MYSLEAYENLQTKYLKVKRDKYLEGDRNYLTKRDL